MMDIYLHFFLIANFSQAKPRTQLLPGFGYNWESGQGEYLQKKSLT